MDLNKVLLSVVPLVCLVMGCNADQDEGDSYVHPMDGGSAASATEVLIGSANIEDDESLFCLLAHPGQTVAVVAGLDPRQRTETIPFDCEDPSYAKTAIKNNVNTLAVLHGEPLPLIFEATVVLDVFGSVNLPYEDDIRLVSLREVDGEWFIVRSVDVTLLDSGSVGGSTPTTEASHLLGDLADECRQVSSGYTSACPRFESFFDKSDDDWRALLLVPNDSTCPAPTPSQGGISDECTDNNPC